MQVQTYEDTDVQSETFEQSIEAQKYINELELTGQQAKSKPLTGAGDSLNAVQKRFPYRLMTDEELFVYSQLCPQKSRLRDYDLSPIPLEVLKTAAYAKSLQDSRIEYMEVWSAASVKVKDPVLVARSDAWGSKNYILARWGEELLPLEVLIPDAIRKWYARRQDSLNEIILQCKRELERPCPASIPSGRSEPYLSI